MYLKCKALPFATVKRHETYLRKIIPPTNVTGMNAKQRQQLAVPLFLKKDFKVTSQKLVAMMPGLWDMPPGLISSVSSLSN
jgi:hypothetical protein